MRDGPQIRNDDVLQTYKTTTAHQKVDLHGRTLFEAFLETDKIFAKYNYPCILAVVADGIRDNPRWVTHIRRNRRRYVVQLHGLTHKNYKNVTRSQLVWELSEAKRIIEDTFEISISTWYPPFGRKGEHPDGPEVCYNLGMKQYEQYGKVDAKLWLKNPEKYPHVNFHFWNDTQVEHVREILCRLREKN